MEGIFEKNVINRDFLKQCWIEPNQERKLEAIILKNEEIVKAMRKRKCYKEKMKAEKTRLEEEVMNNLSEIRKKKPSDMERKRDL
jgi:hypothetical protein